MSSDPSPRRRRAYIALPTLLVTVAAAVLALPVLAVNQTGAFELDGNALTSHAGTGAPDDWDRVCHQVLGTDCSTTTNTNGASAIEFASQGASTGTTFTGGGSKDPIDVSSWAWNQASGGLPGKDILLNGFAARYNLPSNPATCPSSSSTCNVLFFGMDRFDNAGDAQNGFWFFQNAVGLGSTKSGGGQTFTGVHRNGDLLVVSDFSIGGSISTISVYLWNSACTAAGKPTANCADSNLQLLQTSTAANCGTASATAAFCGIVNPATSTTSPWSFTDKKGNASFDQGEFYEGGINLTAFGLGNECFASTLAESRSSTSTSAVLKSFVLGGFGACGSQVKTHPQDSSGNDIGGGSISIGTGSAQPQVQDQAVVTVTGIASWTGSVAFYLCGPADLASQPSCVSGGTSIGSVSVSNSSPTATSALATITSAALPSLGAPFNYCWRGVFTSTTTGVPSSTDGSTTECFLVTPVQPTLGTAAVASPILLGQAAMDNATLTGTANQPGTPVINPTTAGVAAGGTITFTLYGPGNCTTVAAGTGTNPQSVNVNGDSLYGPVSFTPNGVGTYHWVASYSGNSPNTLGTSHNTDCSDSKEDVIVRQLGTSTVTTPVDSSGATVSTVVFGSSVADHALVTGNSADGTPTGSVHFFVCDPTQTSGGVCATGGTDLGSVTAAAVPSSSPPQSQATSAAITANKTGVWCFRAVYTPDTSAYTGSSDASATECFLVNDTTTGSSAQTWRPQDSASVNSQHGAPLNGTLTIQLYTGDNCGATSGSAVAGQSYSSSGSGSSSTITVSSNNTSYDVSVGATVSWLETFTSTDPNVAGFTHCQTSTVTITN